MSVSAYLWENHCLQMETAEARNIESLKEHVAKAFGRTLDSPADFDVMSLSIRERTGEYISPTTLKRLFGYVKPATVPRTSTLSVLSRYAGYAGWSDFCRSLGETWQEHAETGGRRIKPVHVISVSAVLACLAAVVALIFGGRAEPEAVREGQTGQEAEAAAGLPDTIRIRNAILEECMDAAMRECEDITSRYGTMDILEYRKYIDSRYSSFVFTDLRDMAEREAAAAFGDGEYAEKTAIDIFSRCRDYCMEKIYRSFPNDEYIEALEKK